MAAVLETLTGGVIVVVIGGAGRDVVLVTPIVLKLGLTGA